MSDDKSVIDRLQKLGVLKNDIECNKCSGITHKLVTRKRNKDGNDLLSWRCEKCQTYNSVKDNSYFSLFKKPIWFIITLIKYWCLQLPMSTVQDLLKIDDEKNGVSCAYPLILKVYKNMRSICSFRMKNVKIKIGGKNKDVEIDESLVAKVSFLYSYNNFINQSSLKVKYHVGSGLGREQVWLFGLVERGEGGRCYLVIVPDRKAETLLKVICEVCERGTTIIHDSWSSYNKITQCKDFKSMSVNHKINFKDPDTGAHTNKIEGNLDSID